MHAIPFDSTNQEVRGVAELEAHGRDAPQAVDDVPIVADLHHHDGRDILRRLNRVEERYPFAAVEVVDAAR